MIKTKKLIIIGSSSFAEIAHDYFEEDSPYTIEAFSVEKKYVNGSTLKGKKIVPFETLEKIYNPKDYSIFVAIAYAQLNRLRTRLVNSAKEKGFDLASYISSNCFSSNSASYGLHNFIFENNTIQPYTSIGNNVIIWSGNHIGHHSNIGDNCFISSHCVISGHCQIGSSSFIGVNATISNNIKIGKDNWIGPSTLISSDTPDGSIFKTPKTEISKVNSYKMFKLNMSKK